VLLLLLLLLLVVVLVWVQGWQMNSRRSAVLLHYVCDWFVHALHM
jgi:hypothetical protein